MLKSTLLIGVFALCLIAVSSSAYVLKGTVIDGGGTKMSSGSHTVRGSFAQLTIGKISNSNYVAYVGFWHPPYAVGPGIEDNLFFTGPLPRVFSLSQNYPNPVVSGTTIKYSLPREAFVDIRVFNSAGQEIRALVSGTQEPGYYRVNWDMKGVSGEDLPNGVYFYRMRAGEFMNTRKLVILR